MKFIVGIALTFLTLTKSLGQHVLFGERNRKLHENNLFFDKEGFLYPERFISDSSLTKANSSLRLWYHENTVVTDSLLNNFGIAKQLKTTEHQLIAQLNDSLISEKARFLSKNHPSLTFVIHGFRKNFNETGIDVSSVTEFQMFKEAIRRYKSDFEPVAVYWDGLYDCCFSLNSKKNKEIFQLFEQATKHASLVGKQLHRLIEKTSVATVTLIGHSLGAKVAVQFTPDVALSKKYRVCLIAPALSAEAVKQLYLTLPEKAVINWHIVYNENDFVLKKKDNKIGVFGPGVSKYGATGLGCNYHNELLRLAIYLQTNYPAVSIHLDNKTNIGKCHSLRCYTQANALVEVANFISKSD